MPGFLVDIRYSIRSFTRSPGLTIALLLTISFGIGSNVAIHGFVRGLTGRATPLATTDQLVSYAEFLSLRRHMDGFEWLGAIRASQRVIRLAGQSRALSVAAVTPEIAGLLKLSLDGGAVISQRLWQNKLKGEQIRVGATDIRVAGVAPDGLEGLYDDLDVDLWMPLREDDSPKLWVMGKPRRDVSSSQLRAMHMLPFTGMSPEKAQDLARVGSVLSAASAFVFFIACANVTSLLLGRATARSYETSLRVALGAGRRRLARATLSDSIFLAAAGGGLGVLVAVWTSRAVPALLFQQDAERLVFAPDPFSTAATALTCAGIIVACSLLPIFASPHDRPAAILNRESAGPSNAIQRVRSGLVVAQMACSCVLVISTGFLMEGLRTALRTTVTQRLGQPILGTVQAHPDVGFTYFQNVEKEARSIPGVTGMAWADRLPGSRPGWQIFRIEPQGLPYRDVFLHTAAFTSASAATLIYPPKLGRLFGVADLGCRVAIANVEAADALFGDGTVGRSIRDPAGLPVKMIGVLAERKGPGSPTIYYDYTGQTRPPPERAALARFRAPTVSTLNSVELDANIVSPNYFDALGLSLAAGRLFSEASGLGGCRVAVVNREAADQYFGGEAVGTAAIDEAGRRTEIIGIVHSPRLGTFQRRIEPAIYFPMTQDYLPRMTLILGAPSAGDSLLAEVRQKLESVPGRGPAPILVKTLDSHLRETALAPLRIAVVVIGASCGVALLLSILGLYGTLADSARQQGREMAVRVALGARRSHVIRQVLREGWGLAAVGSLAGLFAGILVVRTAPQIVPGNDSFPLRIWLAGPAVLFGVVTVTSLFPARRALLSDPIRLMRGSSQ